MLREMMHFGIYTQENEAVVNKVKLAVITEAVINGMSVVVDDCNMNPKHIEDITELNEQLGVEVKIVDHFLDVPLGVCISRDLRREKKVGADTIKNMYNKYYHLHKQNKK